MGKWRGEQRPVLRAVVNEFDKTGDPVPDGLVSTVTRIPPERVRVALLALEAAHYFAPSAPGGRGIEVLTTAGGAWYVQAPTEAARQALSWWSPGAWPNRSRAALVVSVLSLGVAVVAVIVSIVTA